MSVRFGNEVIVGDLLEEHERKHGALRKVRISHALIVVIRHLVIECM